MRVGAAAWLAFTGRSGGDPHAFFSRCAHLICAAAGGFAALAAGARALAGGLPIFDAHLHYSHDAWERLPPREAVALMRQAGLQRAMVSSSGEGTQRLFEAAPDLVLPVLRPYRTRGEVGSWFCDPTVIAYLESRLKRYRYVALGEFHIYGADADSAVMRRVVQLARQYELFLHSHSGADAIERQFAQDPAARILWAHPGFDTPDPSCGPCGWMRCRRPVWRHFCAAEGTVPRAEGSAPALPNGAGAGETVPAAQAAQAAQSAQSAQAAQPSQAPVSRRARVQCVLRAASSSPAGVSAGTRKRSLAQAPRSTLRQRSLQKGRQRLLSA